MKREAIVTKTGEFVDPTNGNKRKYVIAAVSQIWDDFVWDTAKLIQYINDLSDKDKVTKTIELGECVADFIEKKLSIGFAICNEKDVFDEELGKKIAIGKAKKRPFNTIYSTSKGMISTAMVDAVINQEMRYFESNPGYIITALAELPRK